MNVNERNKMTEKLKMTSWNNTLKVLSDRVDEAILKLLEHTGADGFESEVCDGDDCFHVSVINKNTLSSV